MLSSSTERRLHLVSFQILHRLAVLIKIEKDKTENERPSAAILNSIADDDSIKVEKLVHEFLTAQALKILPQAPFGDAVTQFVSKDDKHAMQAFIDESLSAQFKQILEMEQDDDDLDPIMESFRVKQEALFASGALRRPRKDGKLKPRPAGWDSDLDGEWEDQPGAFVFTEGEEDETPAPTTKRGRPAAAASDDDASIVSATAIKKAPAKRAPAKRAPAKPKATAKAPAKPKAPTKTPIRRRNKVLEPSDDEDEDDVVMLDDIPPPAKLQPKRAATSRGRQTQLNFSQSQVKTQTARELSDDEISDDDDAFEPVAASSRRR
jgi:double-strand break repair protein MRE11